MNACMRQQNGRARGWSCTYSSKQYAHVWKPCAPFSWRTRVRRKFLSCFSPTFTVTPKLPGWLAVSRIKKDPMGPVIISSARWRISTRCIPAQNHVACGGPQWTGTHARTQQSHGELVRRHEKHTTSRAYACAGRAHASLHTGHMAAGHQGSNPAAQQCTSRVKKIGAGG